MPEFIVHHYNFGTSRSFPSYDEAVAYAKRACFEASIITAGNLIASYSPLSGLRSRA